VMKMPLQHSSAAVSSLAWSKCEQQHGDRLSNVGRCDNSRKP
jgi:hypothetical protein